MTNTKTRPSVTLRATDDKINKLLAREKITTADIGDLNEQEQQLFEKKLSEILEQSKGA
jgi:hypothetical protein